MHQDFKRVFKHSMIYGIGSVIGKIGGFILIPVYTRYLPVSEYGKLELIYVTTSFLALFLGGGIAHATLRFFFEYESEKDRRAVIGSALLGMAALGLLSLCALFPLSGTFSQRLLKSPDHAGLFQLAFLLLWLNVSIDISQAYIRAREKSVYYVVVSTVQLFFRLGLNLYFVIGLDLGVKGILLGELISTFLAWILMTAVTVRYSRLCFEWAKLREMYLYSYPILLGSVGALVVNYSDRYFIDVYKNLGAVGLYALGSRFASVLGSLYGESFRQSYGPYRFSIMKREDARNIYSRMLTYFLFGAVLLGVLMAATSKEVIRIVAAPSFWSAYKVVPLILLASIVSQCYYVLQIGIYLQKRTGAVSWILTGVAGLNVVLNILLVPLLGIYGAALASLFSNVGLCVMALTISQRLYRIPYEWGRILQLGIVGTGLFFLTWTLHFDHEFLSLGVKVVVVLLFPFTLYVAGFFHNDELSLLRRGYSKVRVRLFGNPESTEV